jgi:hypothetical protein
MPPLTFGILSFPITPYDELVRIWRDVEALGFDSAWRNRRAFSTNCCVESQSVMTVSTTEQ